MFVGEYLCLLLFKKTKQSQPKFVLTCDEEGTLSLQPLRTQINPALFALPALLDMLATALQMLALLMINASVY